MVIIIITFIFRVKILLPMHYNSIQIIRHDKILFSWKIQNFNINFINLNCEKLCITNFTAICVNWYIWLSGVCYSEVLLNNLPTHHRWSPCVGLSWMRLVWTSFRSLKNWLPQWISLRVTNLHLAGGFVW